MTQKTVKVIKIFLLAIFFVSLCGAIFALDEALSHREANSADYHDVKKWHKWHPSLRPDILEALEDEKLTKYEYKKLFGKARAIWLAENKSELNEQLGK